MKPVIIIAISVVLLIASLLVFAQSSEKSLAFSVRESAAYASTAFVILIIPVLIVLGFLKWAEALSSESLKNIGKVLGLLFLGLIVVNLAAYPFFSDYEKFKMNAEEEKERNSERIEAIMKESKASSEKAYNEKYADDIRLGIDPKSIENLEWSEDEFGPEWDNLDTLIEQQRSGEITFNQECQIIANLMNQNISDDYLYAFWHDAFLQECN